MAITHSTTVRNAIADTVVDSVDTGTTDAAGDFVIKDAGAATPTLVSITLQSPAFNSATGGSATLQGSPSATASASGTADTFVVQNKDNSQIFSGSVGTSGSDFNLSTTSVQSSETVQITSFTYNAPS